MKNALLATSLLILFAACRKDKQTYTVTGRLLQDCSGAPVAGRNLRVGLDYTPDGVSNTPASTSNAGSGVTGSDGSFSFTITANPNWDEFQLLDSDSGGNYTYNFTVNLEGGNRGGEIAVGTIYRRAVAIGTVRIEVPGTVGTNDTLYYGPANAPRTLYPVSATTINYVVDEGGSAVLSGDNTASETGIYWGLGRAAFDSSVRFVQQNGASATGARYLTVPLYICTAGQQIATLVVR